MRTKGFTIVELLIVTVVIAILATISIVAYNGIQERARQTKIDSDMTQLEKAITIARFNSGEIALRYVTGSVHTGTGCWSKADGTDLAALASTDPCIAQYNATLEAISTASDMDVRGLRDPWGRPYLIDENEQETASCQSDRIGIYTRPFVTDGAVNVYNSGNTQPITTVTC